MPGTGLLNKLGRHLFSLEASHIAQLVKNMPAMQETPVRPTPEFLGFPGGSAGKESACNAADLGLIPGLGRSPGEGNSYPLQYIGLENSMDGIVHGVAKSQTRLNDFHSFTHYFHLVQTDSLYY